MSPLYNLLDELLTMVIVLLVTSCDGAADLARLSATCRKFRTFAKNSSILKIVNFDRIPYGDYEAHNHIEDLMLLCARVGNVAAESRVAKALLHNDYFYWTLILEHDEPLLISNPQAAGILCHRKLIRSFIRHANYEEISKMRFRLFSYTITFLGYQEARGKGILLAITNMTDYYRSLRDTLFNVFDIQANGNEYVANERVEPTLPPEDFEQNRAVMLTLYDQMFPLSHE